MSRTRSRSRSRSSDRRRYRENDRDRRGRYDDDRDRDRERDRDRDRKSRYNDDDRDKDRSSHRSSRGQGRDTKESSENAARKSRLDMLKRMQGEEIDEGTGEVETQEEVNIAELTEEEQMAKLLGIGGFDTTKGKHVKDNDSTAARGASGKTKTRGYRQYMNRKVIRKDGLFGMQGPAGKGASGKGKGKGGY